MKIKLNKSHAGLQIPERARCCHCVLNKKKKRRVHDKRLFAMRRKGLFYLCAGVGVGEENVTECYYGAYAAWRVYRITVKTRMRK